MQLSSRIFSFGRWTKPGPPRATPTHLYEVLTRDGQLFVGLSVEDLGRLYTEPSADHATRDLKHRLNLIGALTVWEYEIVEHGEERLAVAPVRQILLIARQVLRMTQLAQQVEEQDMAA